MEITFNSWNNVAPSELLYTRRISYSSTSMSGLFLHDLTSDTIIKKNTIQREGTDKKIYTCEMQQDFNTVWACSIFYNSDLIGQAEGKKKTIALCQAFECAVTNIDTSNTNEDILSKIASLDTLSPKLNDFSMYLKKRKVGEILLLLNICMKERGLHYTIDVEEDGDGSFICSVMCNSLLICRTSETTRCNAMRMASGRTINTLIQIWPLENQLINNREGVTSNHKKEVTSNNKKEVTLNQNEVVSNNKKELKSKNIPEGTSNEKQEMTSDNKQEVTSIKHQKVTEQEEKLNDCGSDLPNEDADSFQEETKDNDTELHLGKQQSNLPTRKILPINKLPQRVLFPHQRANPAFTKHLPVADQSIDMNSKTQKVASNRRTSVKKAAPQPVDLTAIPSEAPQVPKATEPYSTSNSSSPSSKQGSVNQPKFQQNQKQISLPKSVNKQTDIMHRLDACMKEHNLEYTFELEKCPDKKFECTIYCNSDLFIQIKGKDKLTTRYLALQQAIAKVRKTYGFSAAKTSNVNDSKLLETINDNNNSSAQQQDTKENVSIVPTQTEDLIIFEDNDMELCNDDDDEYSEPHIELPVPDQYIFLNENAQYGFSNGECPDAEITQQPSNFSSADDQSEEDSSSSKVLWPWELPQKISSKYVSVLSKMSQNETSTPSDEDTESSLSSFKLDDISLEHYLGYCMKERGFTYSHCLKQFSDKSYLCSVFCDSALFHCSRGKDIPEAQALAFQRSIEKLKKWFKIKEEPGKNSNANDLYSLKGPDKPNQSNKNKDVVPAKKKVISNFLKQVRSDRIVNAYSNIKKDDKIDIKQEKPPEDILPLKKVDKQDDRIGANKNSSIKESSKREDRLSSHDSKSLLASNSSGHDRSNHSGSSDPRRSNKRDNRTITPALKDTVSTNKSRQEVSKYSTNSSLRQSSKRDDKSVASEIKKFVSSNSLQQKTSDPDENSYSKWFGKKENSGITPPHVKNIGTPNSQRNERFSCSENSLSKRNDKKKEKRNDSGVNSLATSNILQSDKCDLDDNSYTKWFGKKHDGTTMPHTGTVPSNKSKQEEKVIAPVIKELANSYNLKQEKCDPNENFLTKCISRIATALRNSIVIPNTPRTERSNIDKNSFSKANISKQERENCNENYSKRSNDKREEKVIAPVTKELANLYNLRQEKYGPGENPYSKWFVKTPNPHRGDAGNPNTPKIERSDIDKNSYSKTNNSKQERSNCNDNSFTKPNDKKEEKVTAPVTKELANLNIIRQEQCNAGENPYSKWFVKTPTPLRRDTVTPNTPRTERSDITSPHTKDIVTTSTTGMERFNVDENYCSKLGNKSEERIAPLSIKDAVALNSLRWVKPAPTDNSLVKQCNKRERSISPHPIKEIKKTKIENFVLLEDSKFKQNDPYSILRRSAAFNKVYLWPKFHNVAVKNNTIVHKCSLMIGDELLTEAEGSTSGEAQFKASVLALTKLKSRRPTIKIFSYDT